MRARCATSSAISTAFVCSAAASASTPDARSLRSHRPSRRSSEESLRNSPTAEANTSMTMTGTTAGLRAKATGQPMSRHDVVVLLRHALDEASRRQRASAQPIVLCGMLLVAASGLVSTIDALVHPRENRSRAEDAAVRMRQGAYKAMASLATVCMLLGVQPFAAQRRTHLLVALFAIVFFIALAVIKWLGVLVGIGGGWYPMHTAPGREAVVVITAVQSALPVVILGWALLRHFDQSRWILIATWHACGMLALTAGALDIALASDECAFNGCFAHPEFVGPMLALGGWNVCMGALLLHPRLRLKGHAWLSRALSTAGRFSPLAPLIGFGQTDPNPEQIVQRAWAACMPTVLDAAAFQRLSFSPHTAGLNGIALRKLAVLTGPAGSAANPNGLSSPTHGQGSPLGARSAAGLPVVVERASNASALASADARSCDSGDANATEGCTLVVPPFVGGGGGSAPGQRGPKRSSMGATVLRLSAEVLGTRGALIRRTAEPPLARNPSSAPASGPPSEGNSARGTALDDDDADAVPTDFYIVHSWKDEPSAKRGALVHWARAFAAEHGRPPAVWLDALSCDPAAETPGEQLASLPVRLARARQLLVLLGPTVVDRLWCVIELYVWRVLGGQMEDVVVLPIGAPGDSRATASVIASVDAFHVMHCAATREEDALRIVHAVELAGVSRVNDVIRAFLPAVRAACARLESGGAQDAGSPARAMHGAGAGAAAPSSAGVGTNQCQCQARAAEEGRAGASQTAAS